MHLTRDRIKRSQRYTALVAKPHLVIVLSVFLVSYLLQSLFHALESFAEDPIDHTRLVALFVDTTIYDAIKPDLQRYTVDYIQASMSNTKVLVMPIDTSNTMAWDIEKVIDNLYQEGEEDSSSTLEGLILVGDIPLPVINDRGYVYPSIYPYVDREDTLYVFDQDSHYFELNPVSNKTPQPELWHGVMPFGNDPDAYHQFFTKLKRYASNPGDFVAKKIWYDDLVQMKQTFLHDNVGYYANNFLFAEDMAYKRQTNLMVDVMQESHERVVQDTLGELADAVAVDNGDNNPATADFDDAFDNYANTVNTALSDTNSSLESTKWLANNVPTLFLEKTMRELMKPYTELYAASYRSTLARRLAASGRWNNSSLINSHIEKTSHLDDLLVRNINTDLEPVVMSFNQLMEEVLNQQIASGNYHMVVPILTRVDEYDDHQISVQTLAAQCSGDVTTWKDNPYEWDLKNLWAIWENYYFGSPVYDIQNPLDLTFYRWSYLNFTGLEQLHDYNYEDTSDFAEARQKSVWWSYGFNDRQVMASRGYNALNAKADQAKYDVHDEIMKGCKDLSMEEFVRSYWWWHSPLNLGQNTNGGLALKNPNELYAWKPLWDQMLFNTDIGWTLYDIAGARLTPKKIEYTNSILSSSFYKNVEKITRKVTGLPLFFKKEFVAKRWLFRYIIPVRYCKLDERDFFQLPSDFFWWYSKNRPWLTRQYMSSDQTRVCGEKQASLGNWFYPHFIMMDSRQYNTAPTVEQLSGMNITTPDRPIDSKRNVSFAGVGGDIVTFVYPNLYHVEVFSGEDKQTLLSADDIKTHIIDYLHLAVENYNQQLLAQKTKAPSYYNSHKDAFDFLSGVTAHASPNRDYNLLPQDFFVDYLGDQAINSIAALLYRHNLPWSEKVSKTDVLDDIRTTLLHTDLNAKVSKSFTDYLTKQTGYNAITLPAYEADGYEVSYLNSDRQDYLFDDSAVPAVVNDIQTQQYGDPSMSLLDLAWSTADHVATVCGYPISEWLLVYDIKKGESPWRNAVKCRWEEMKKKPFGISASFSTDAPVVAAKALHSIASYVGDWSAYQEQRSNWWWLYQDRQEEEDADKELLSQGRPSVDQLASIHHALSFSLDPYSVSVDPEATTQTAMLRISASQDIGPIPLRLSSTGVNCLGVASFGDRLCDEAVTRTINPYQEELLLPITVYGNRVGESDLIARICIAGDCIHKRATLSFTQGAVSRISILSSLDKVIRASRLPFSLEGFDAFNNRIWLQSDELVVRVDHGHLSNDGAKQLSFFDFRDTHYIYYAPDDQNISTDTIRVYKKSLGKPDVLITEKTVLLVNARLQVSVTNNPITSLAYSLPDSLASLYTVDSALIPQLVTSRIPSLQLKLLDDSWQAVWWYISVQSISDFMRVGVVRSLPYRNDSASWQLYQTRFVEQPDFFLTWGWVTIALFPRGPAGNDVLRSTIAGHEQGFDLPLQVYHASPFSLSLSVSGAQYSEQAIALNKSSTRPLDVTVRDYRWNIVTTDVPLALETFGSVSFDWEDTVFVTATGLSSYRLTTADHGWRGYVSATIEGRDLSQQRAAVAVVTVQDSFIPLSGLNTLYLNLRWSDWWNIIDTAKHSQVQHMFASSDKLLWMTSPLLNESDIAYSPFTIDRHYQVRSSTLPDSIFFDPSLASMRVGRIASFALPSYTIRFVTGRDQVSFAHNTSNSFVGVITDDSFSWKSSKLWSRQLWQWDHLLWDSSTQFTDPSFRIIYAGSSRNNYALWQLLYRWSSFGEAVFFADNATLTENAVTITDTHFQLSSVWAGGWTNTVRIRWLSSAKPYQLDLSYQSITDSNDPAKDIWFLGDFANITLFAQGERLWEATRQYSSPYAINIGDPLLERIEHNPTIGGSEYDDWPGQRIYADEWNGVKFVKDIDFNNDALRDMVIAHHDGSMSLLKNYGGNDAYHDLWALLFAADGIRDVFVGDVDANGYDDILVWTNTNRLRVYKNELGSFDVDGNPLCLGVAWWPDSLDRVYQLFVQDMDKDGVVDVISNDRDGFIKIFYGWSDNQWDYYVSNDRYRCDDSRSDRQNGQQTIVKQRGLSLNAQDLIHDGSLVRRQGLTYNPFSDPEADSPLADDYGTIGDYGDDTNTIDIGDIMWQLWQTPLDQLVDDAAGDVYRYHPSPFQRKPSFDSALSVDDIYYVPSYSISDSDPVDVYKQYVDHNGWTLDAGDTVTVTVTMKARSDVKFSYIDQIQWPREVSLDNQWYLNSFDPSNFVTAYTYIAEQSDSYYYMLDDIQLAANQTVSYSYHLRFVWSQLVRIAVADINKDSYPDIKAFPTQACVKVRRDYTNQRNRIYTESLTDLGKLNNDYIQQAQDQMSDALGQLGADLEDSLAATELSQLAGLWPQWTAQNKGRDNIRQWLLGNNNDSLTLDIGWEAWEKISQFIDDATQWLCHGFSDLFGVGKKHGCKWLPVPFNMAFLAPGIYNIMGCRLMQDKWLPIFHFPGTLQTPVGPIPFPRGQKWPGDSFYRAWWGVYPSMIRIYLAPTLTLQLWVAVCLWPMGVGINLPKPFANIAGNCIVTKIPLPIAGCSDTSPWGAGGDEDENAYGDDWVDQASMGSCNDVAFAATQGNSTSKTTPFSLVNVLADDTYTPALQPWIYGWGLLSFDMKPVDVLENFDSTDPIDLRWGKAINLKLQGWSMKWLAQCIVQDWFDRQLSYMLNNLTTMAISIYLPDPGNLLQWFSSLSFGAWQDIYNEENRTDLLNRVQEEHDAIETSDSVWFERYYSQLQQSNRPSYSSIQDTTQRYSMNPFDALSQLFEQVPLVNIQTKDVALKIPAVTTDDLIRYGSYMEAWTRRNGAVLKDRQDVLQWALWLCESLAEWDVPGFGDFFSNPEAYAQKWEKLRIWLEKARLSANNELIAYESLPPSPTTKEQIAKRKSTIQTIDQCLQYSQETQLQQFISFSDNSSKLMQSVRENINALEAYKRFPQQLSQRIQSIDRYMLDIANFVDDFLGQITRWLDTNSRLFEQRVDAIILLVGAIETRQAVIDLLVNRKANCSTCSNDNYDYFSCSLSFLCPKLPILPIPPFKIPNIIIDASHLDLGIDIMLPKLTFIPEPIPFPDLPDLPAPPTISINALSLDLYVPEIPIIPTPPALPPLPTFIPRVTLELPSLPPAPAIPKISSKIQKVLKIGKVIGKLYCIMKWGIGLVGEKAVKSKIEQLTQRTWQVPIFDYFNLTSKRQQPPLQWFDYQVDAFVDFNIDFNAAINAVENLADQWNGFVTQKLYQWTLAFDSLNTTLDDAEDALNQLPGSITIDPIDLQWYYEAQDYKEAYDDMRHLLSAVRDYDEAGIHRGTLDRVEHLISYREENPFHTSDIERTKKDFVAIMHQHQQDLDRIVADITDYDRFVAQLDHDNYTNSYRSGMQLTLRPLGSDDALLHHLSGFDNPYQSYANTQQQIIAWYQWAISQQVSQQQELASIPAVRQALAALDQTQMSLLALSETLPSAVHTRDSQPLLAAPNKQLAQNGPTAWSAVSTAQFDVSRYIKGVFVPGSWDSSLSIISSPELIDRFMHSYYQTDLNGDQHPDLILRDEGSVFVKYAQQYPIHDAPSTTHYRDYFEVPLVTKQWRLGDAHGFVSSRVGWRYKVRDHTHSVYNVSMVGQSFDSISLQRSQHWLFGLSADAYLMRLSARVDVLEDSSQLSTQIVDRYPHAYILAVPQNTVMEGLRVEIDGKLVSVTQALWTAILDVLYYNDSQDEIALTLTDLAREWHYLQIQALQTDGSTKKYHDYYPASPRSKQIVWWQQILADEEWPIPTPTLVRPSLSAVISTGTTLYGYVGTYYDLTIHRQDDIGVVENWIIEDGVSTAVSGASQNLSWLYFTGTTTKTYSIWAKDANNNQTQQKLLLTILSPDISIAAITPVSDSSVSITAQLSHDIDEWFVSFAHYSLWQWTVMEALSQWNTKTHFAVGPGVTLITGWLFTIGNDVGLFAADDSLIGSINPENGSITLNSSDYHLSVSFVTWWPIVFVETTNGTKIFAIYLPPLSLVKPWVTLSNKAYRTIPLDSPYFWDFYGGSCIATQDNDCILYVNLKGSIYVPPLYRDSVTADYGFTESTETVDYQIRHNNTSVGTIKLKAQSMLF